MNRKTLLTVQVKAELWAAVIVRKHEKKFANLMETVNVPPTSTIQAALQQEKAGVSSGNAFGQPGASSLPESF